MWCFLPLPKKVLLCIIVFQFRVTIAQKNECILPLITILYLLYVNLIVFELFEHNIISVKNLRGLPWKFREHFDTSESHEN